MDFMLGMVQFPFMIGEFLFEPNGVWCLFLYNNELEFEPEQIKLPKFHYISILVKKLNQLKFCRKNIYSAVYKTVEDSDNACDEIVSIDYEIDELEEALELLLNEWGLHYLLKELLNKN